MNPFPPIFTHMPRLRDLAEHAQFAAFCEQGRELAEKCRNDAKALLLLGIAFADYGFVTDAVHCYKQVLRLMPNDIRALINIAAITPDLAVRRLLTKELCTRLPDAPVVHRNYLNFLCYDPEATCADMLQAAREWGSHVTTGLPRPSLPDIGPMRIGFVSADFNNHTVGNLFHPMLRHMKNCKVFTYSSSTREDDITNAIQLYSNYRNIAALTDAELAAQIQADGIDILIDLSGHTKGSRLTCFALRPAPILCEWLGYCGTTGLPYMDAILTDIWHGDQEQFSERVIRLPTGRLCYQPPHFVHMMPQEHNRHDGIRFCSFNNTMKYNGQVFDLWARVLEAVPGSTLTLKWRTFNDDIFCATTWKAFEQRGIQKERIILHGPSFHKDMLLEYLDMDIALDPFPFCGCQTSLEALWMGVPVVTLPLQRMASRQTHAILHQIGLPELSARNADDYVRIAVDLANSKEKLATLRSNLRERMAQSQLMDVKKFAEGFVATLKTLWLDIKAKSRA